LIVRRRKKKRRRRKIMASLWAGPPEVDIHQ